MADARATPAPRPRHVSESPGVPIHSKEEVVQLCKDLGLGGQWTASHFHVFQVAPVSRSHSYE